MTEAGILLVLALVISAVITVRVPTENGNASGFNGGPSDTSYIAEGSRQESSGLIKFEGQHNQDQNQYGLITFKGQPGSGGPLKFDDGNFDIQETNANFNFPSGGPDSPFDVLNFPPENFNDLENKPATGVVFQDNNDLDVQNQRPMVQKKKRRRRRKPRLQQIPGQGYPGVRPVPGEFRPGENPHVNPSYPGQFQRPHRRPKQSPGSQALTAITEALTSVALYDDYQCVPRLLCEAASGGALAAAGSSPVLQSIANLQPVLTLLAAYNGASTSPLFVFGRAVFLGMTSKNNPGTCRYAYSQCPNDPEQLVHYLNNHNGGFFRFFSAPQYPNSQLGQQNLEQFYNQLADPGQYGFQSNFLNQANPPSQYGLQQNIPGQNYGIHSPYPVDQFNGYHQQRPGIPGQFSGQQHNYGLFPNVPNHNVDVQASNLYNGYQQSYGYGYPYQDKYGLNQYRVNNNNTEVHRAQKRIQNINSSDKETTVEDYGYDDRNTKWSFPDSPGSTRFYIDDERKIRGGRQLQFPETETTQNVNREAKGFYFPEAQSNRQYYDLYNPMISFFNNNQHSNGNANTKTSNVNHNIDNSEDGFDIIYIVRGDGDPNNPEIHRIRSGEKVY